MPLLGMADARLGLGSQRMRGQPSLNRARKPGVRVLAAYTSNTDAAAVVRRPSDLRAGDFIVQLVNYSSGPILSGMKQVGVTWAYYYSTNVYWKVLTANDIYTQLGDVTGDFQVAPGNTILLLRGPTRMNLLTGARQDQNNTPIDPLSARTRAESNGIGLLYHRASWTAGFQTDVTFVAPPPWRKIAARVPTQGVGITTSTWIREVYERDVTAQAELANNAGNNYGQTQYLLEFIGDEQEPYNFIDTKTPLRFASSSANDIMGSSYEVWMNNPGSYSLANDQEPGGLLNQPQTDGDGVPISGAAITVGFNGPPRLIAGIGFRVETGGLSCQWDWAVSSKKATSYNLDAEFGVRHPQQSAGVQGLKQVFLPRDQWFWAKSAQFRILGCDTSWQFRGLHFYEGREDNRRRG